MDNGKRTAWPETCVNYWKPKTEIERVALVVLRRRTDGEGSWYPFRSWFHDTAFQRNRDPEKESFKRAFTAAVNRLSDAGMIETMDSGSDNPYRYMARPMTLARWRALNRERSIRRKKERENA